jgi:hypothetical protein
MPCRFGRRTRGRLDSSWIVCVPEFLPPLLSDVYCLHQRNLLRLFHGDALTETAGTTGKTTDRKGAHPSGANAPYARAPQGGRPETCGRMGSIRAPLCAVLPSRVLDARSLAMHVAIARKIERAPELLDIPRRNLERWSARSPDSPPPWLREWRQILRRPWPEIAALISELSENAARLRQSSPFAGVLTPAERRRIYEAFRA